MDIFGSIIFWLMIAGLAVVGLGGIVMLGTGIKNMRGKDHSGTDVLLIILGAIIMLVMVALIVSLIWLNFSISAELQRDPLYSFRV